MGQGLALQSYRTATMSRLKERTREMLLERPRTKTYEIIAKDTGLHKRWIEDFAKNPHHDQGVAKVEKLYEYLSGRTLDI